MDIIITAKNFGLTPSVRTLVEEKFSRLEHFWSRILRINVEMKVSRKHRHGRSSVVFVHLETPGPDIRATVESDDLRTAIDLVYPKLERQILRAKERFRR